MSCDSRSRENEHPPGARHLRAPVFMTAAQISLMTPPPHTQQALIHAPPHKPPRPPAQGHRTQSSMFNLINALCSVQHERPQLNVTRVYLFRASRRNGVAQIINEVGRCGGHG